MIQLVSFASSEFRYRTVVWMALLAACFASDASAAPVAGSIVRDQHLEPSSGWSRTTSSRDIAQSFPVTIGGFLDRVDIYVNHQASVNGNMFWDIRRLSGGAPIANDGAALASGSIPIASLPDYFSPTPVQLDVSASNIRVRPGDTLAIVIQGSDGGAYWLSHYAGNPGVKFERFGAGPWEADSFSPERARSFSTYVRIIPEPSGLYLAMLLACTTALVRQMVRKGAGCSSTVVSRLNASVCRGWRQLPVSRLTRREPCS